MKYPTAVTQTGRRYVRQEVEAIDTDYSPGLIAMLDALSHDVAVNARILGLDRSSDEFAAAVLLAAHTLNCLAASLEVSGERNCRAGADYLRQAVKRMKVICLWHKVVLKESSSETVESKDRLAS